MLQTENNNPLNKLNFNLNWKYVNLNLTGYQLHRNEI